MIYNEELLNDIKEKLLAKNETIAVAESVTSGHIQAAISLAMDASKFYQGGITAYNLGQKTRHLNIEPIHAGNLNCVDDNIAGAMAQEVAKMFLSDYGIGITGYASIVPENEKEGLFAFMAISYKNKVIVARRLTSKESKIYDVQVDYTSQVLTLLHGWLMKVKK